MKYQQSDILKKIFFCLILLFLGFMSATVTHAETYTFVTKWGSHGSSDGQFIAPIGIDVDSSENVYVADFGNHRIQKFDSNGNFITQWGSFGTGNGQFNYPRDVAVDSSDNVYVAEERNNRIQKFDSNGNFITQWGSSGTSDGQLSIPVCIAVDSSSNVYIMDLAATTSGWAYPRVQKFSSDGTFISKLGSQGSGDGQLDGPNGIAVDSSDNVYVADTGNNRIQKFDSKGNFITKWGSNGSSDAQFYSMNGIGVDSSDNVYVADTGNNRIQKFDSNGNFITQWGSFGIDYGQFKYPWDITVDSLGNAYVTDTENNRIQKFSIEQIIPTITWSNPADIISGTALSSTQLNAIASVPGTFVYTPPLGTILSAGTQTLHVDFTPTDNSNYSNSSKDVTINVSEQPVLPVADFSASSTTGNAPLKVSFTDKSIGSPTAWKWSFGDGSALVTEHNPTHTYSTPGVYTVKETVSNAAGKDTEIKTNYITVTAPLKAPVAAFSASPTSGNTPLKVVFTDKSTNSPKSWKWNFGDGTYSTVKNPVYTYNKAGKYTISLTATNKAGSNTATKSSYIVVSVLKAPVANFSASPTSGKAPLKVQFTDKSTNSPTSWKWSFGDGTYSTSKNPTHTYGKVGKYTVSLTAKNVKGSYTKTIAGYVLVSKK